MHLVTLEHHRLQQLGSQAASLGGLYALVFTVGIGESSAMIQRRVCRDAARLGIKFDEDANKAHASGFRRISTADSRVATKLIVTDEELIFARHTLTVLQGPKH